LSWESPGGQSARLELKVCEHRADSPRPSSGQSEKNTSEPPVPHQEKRTVRALSSDDPRAIGAMRIVRGLQAACTRMVRYPYTDGLTNHLQQNFDTPKDLRANSQELDEHGKNTDRTDSPRPRSGRSARHEQNSPRFKPRSQPLLPFHGFPKRLEQLRIDLGTI
jgi:hypothetical protein